MHVPCLISLVNSNSSNSHSSRSQPVVCHVVVYLLVIQVHRLLYISSTCLLYLILTRRPLYSSRLCLPVCLSSLSSLKSLMVLPVTSPISSFVFYSTAIQYICLMQYSVNSLHHSCLLDVLLLGGEVNVNVQHRYMSTYIVLCMMMIFSIV